MFIDCSRSRHPNDEYTDFTLQCGEKEVRCHKFVLATASPYFEELFLSGSSQDSVCLPAMEYNGVMDVLTLIYDGVVSVEKDRLQGFEHAERTFKISEVLECDGSSGVDTKEEKIPVEAPA